MINLNAKQAKNSTLIKSKFLQINFNICFDFDKLNSI